VGVSHGGGARSLEKKGLLDEDEFRAIAGATLGGS